MPKVDLKMIWHVDFSSVADKCDLHFLASVAVQLERFTTPLQLLRKRRQSLVIINSRLDPRKLISVHSYPFMRGDDVIPGYGLSCIKFVL